MGYITIFIALSLVAAIALTVLSAILFSIRIKHNRVTRKLSIMCRLMAIAYLLLSIPGYFTFLAGLEYNHEVLSLLVLPMTSIQSLLFSFSLLIMMDPDYMTPTRIARHFVQVGVGVAVYTCMIFYFNASWVIYMVIIAILCQMALYTLVFIRRYRINLKRMANYYSDGHYNCLWAKHGFFSALGIGTFAVFTLLLSETFFYIFILVYIAFYTWFAIRIFNYVSNLAYYLTAVTAPVVEQDKLLQSVESDSSLDSEMQAKCSRMDATLKNWVEQKGYLNPELDREYIISKSKTDLDFFRWFFQTNMSCEFRTWRASLRIEEAKHIIGLNPDISMNELSSRLGFITSQNFYKHFKKSTGLTPREYQQSLKEL